jgi:hypothetical protein
MSQVFAADGVTNTAGGSMVLTNVLTAVTGNFISPPFGNAKALVSATVSLIAGTGTTGIYLSINRNPQAENLNLTPGASTTVAAGSASTITLQVTDRIPDGRPVQYNLNVNQNGSATGNGTVSFASIQTILISG